MNHVCPSLQTCHRINDTATRRGSSHLKRIMFALVKSPCAVMENVSRLSHGPRASLWCGTNRRVSATPQLQQICDISACGCGGRGPDSLAARTRLLILTMNFNNIWTTKSNRTKISFCSSCTFCEVTLFLLYTYLSEYEYLWLQTVKQLLLK